jgi:hypothetical protein
MRERAGEREGEGRQRDRERSACGMYEEARGGRGSGMGGCAGKNLADGSENGVVPAWSAGFVQV